MAKYRTADFKGPLMRVSYAFNLFDSREQERDDGTKIQQWGCTLIVPKTAGEVSLLTGAVRECVEKEWGPDGLERLKKGLIKNPIIDGGGPSGLNKETGEVKAGLGPDVWFIRPNTQRQPVVWVIKGGEYVKASKEECPSGYWGIPELHAYAWHHTKNGSGVSFGITQFLVRKEDTILGGDGGARDPESAFGKIDTSEIAGEAKKPESAASMFD